MPTTIITIHAHKGGVGKTTASVAIASALAEQGQRVLAIDTDDQSDMTAAFFGPDASTSFNKLNTTAALFDEQLEPTPEDLIQKTDVANIWLVASSPLLAQHSDHNRFTEFALREFIELVSDAFDFVLIDTPPSINSQSTWASLLAANAVLMCVQLEPFSGHSLSRGEKIIEMARKAGNPQLQFLGYLPTLKDQRLKIHSGYEASLRELYEADVFQTVMTRLSAYPEAQHNRVTVLQYDGASAAAKNTVRELGEEIRQRLRKAA